MSNQNHPLLQDGMTDLYKIIFKSKLLFPPGGGVTLLAHGTGLCHVLRYLIESGFMGMVFSNFSLFGNYGHGFLKNFNC